MSMTQIMPRIGSIARCKYFTRAHIWSSCHGFQTIVSSSPRVPFIPKYKNKCDFLRQQTFRSFNLKNVVVHSGAQSGTPLPSDPSSSSWKFWILGVLISVILPFWSNKWGTFKKLENEVEAVVETAEHVADIVEKVAEGVEKLAEDVANQLPQEGKLKDAVTFVENVAKITANDAHLAEEIIEKVEEVEKEVESIIDPVIDQASERTNE